MFVIKTNLPEVLLLEPEVYSDSRGRFFETYNDRRMIEIGICLPFVQDNQSASAGGVLRGLHYQQQRPQGKLVRVVQGEVFDVAVDIRPGSPRFGQWTGHRLSADNRHMLWVPPGFAHGFLAMSYWAEVVYKVTDYYIPELERAIAWNDPAIGIKWPTSEVPEWSGQVHLSDRDRNAGLLKDMPQ